MLTSLVLLLPQDIMCLSKLVRLNYAAVCTGMHQGSALLLRASNPAFPCQCYHSFYRTIFVRTYTINSMSAQQAILCYSALCGKCIALVKPEADFCGDALQTTACTRQEC